MRRPSSVTLKRIKESTGMNNKELAEAIGATPFSVSRWVNGHSKPRAKFWKTIRELDKQGKGATPSQREFVQRAIGEVKTAIDYRKVRIITTTWASMSVEERTLAKNLLES